MRLSLPLVALAIVSGAASEPVILDWSALLGSVTADTKLQATSDRVNLLKTKPDPGLWDKLELRYETTGDLREHKIDARLSPYAFGERTATRNLWNAKLTYNQAKQALALSKALRDRYKLGLQWIYRQKQLAYHQNLYKVYADRIQVHMTFAGTERFDPEDLVSSQQKLADLQGEILSDQNDIAELEQELRTLIPGWSTVDLDTAGLLTVAELRQNFERLPNTVDSLFPEYRVQLERYRQAERDEKLDEASIRNYVSYLNVGYKLPLDKHYGWDDDKTALEELSIGVGVKVPFGDGANLETLGSRLDVIDERSELLDCQWDLTQDLNELHRTGGSLVRRMAVQDSFAAKVDAGALFTDYAVRAGSDPLLLLKARATGIQTSWNSEQLLFDAYFVYLDLLQTSGVLVRDPGTNHMKKGALLQ